MKKIHGLLAIIAWLLWWPAAAQPASLGLGTSAMPIGAYYYPEHWQPQQWERDIKRMASLGFSFTHYAEFAWAALEPAEGQYNFGWLDSCVNMAHRYGLKVIMCTPSPCPPAWLSQKHPEILVVGEDGRTIQHGMRLNANGANPVYQRYIEKIVTAMAQRYGQHPAVAGWQLDNEPHIHGHYDYSAFAASDFRAWLQRRYGSIDSLNKAWGAAFWSLTYQQFEQIRIPNAKEGFSNPHATLDFQRYTADALAGALRFQAGILRQHIAARQWITTNFAYYKFLPAVDLFRSRPDLDFASHTMYLLSTFLNTAGDSMAHRLGSGMELAFSSEMARSVRGYTGIMELQPGQINWGQWNSQPLPGAVRMWIWHSFGLGDLFTCTYRFRQPLYGSEQFHKGIMEPDGVTVAPGGQEYVTAIKEINALPALANTAMPAEVAKRRTAFLWSQDNLLGMEGSKHTNSWDSWQHYYHYYSALKSMGASVHFLHETDSFDVASYPTMVAPAYEMLDEALVAKMQRYVANGGTLVLSTRTGMKNKHGHLWETLLQQPIWPLIGASVQYYDQLPPGTQSQVQMDGRSYPWQVWADVLKPHAGTNVLASHTQQFYKGQAAVVQRSIGKGKLYYVGVASAGGHLEKAVLQKAWQVAGIPAMQLPPYVFVEWRDGYYVAVNYSANPYQLPLTQGQQVVLGAQRLLPGAVTVYKNR